MPLVQVKVLEGVFSDAQKQEMIRKLTDAMGPEKCQGPEKVSGTVSTTFHETVPDTFSGA
jgi:hypothetical protein